MIFAATLAAGALAVLAIALAPAYAGRVEHGRATRLGSALVALAVGIALLAFAAPGVSTVSSSALFLGAFVSLVVGSVFLLADDGDDRGDDGYGGGDEPPWWPEFEHEFRSLARRQRRTVGIR